MQEALRQPVFTGEAGPVAEVFRVNVLLSVYGVSKSAVLPGLNMTAVLHCRMIFSQSIIDLASGIKKETGASS